jgi:hypothetical protein
MDTQVDRRAILKKGREGEEVVRSRGYTYIAHIKWHLPNGISQGGDIYQANDNPSLIGGFPNLKECEIYDFKQHSQKV